MTQDRIQLTHPDPTKQHPKIERVKYDAFHEALLEVIPANEEGIPFGSLNDAVLEVNPSLQEMGSVGWYVTTVKLHMEAIGEIERVPQSSPQRVRRVK
jgi:hypothetical protein